ncbi:ATP-binding protein [Sphingomonas panacis]|uniref:ATP-binding protein n=1 Tax=Sphingomonas panacis TaxID=1560345 RepID=UPI001F0AAF04|nr:winged helix-turn-helix domain-containing protein [Sphingomonas panacis]
MISERTSFQFGNFELIPDRQALLHHGEAVALGGRAFDILTLLVRRAGETVNKAELFAHVWPGYLVHEHNLKVNIGNLRRILAACDPETDYIVTIAGRGYKFVAALNNVEEAPAKPPAGSSGLRLTPPPTAPHLYGRDDALHQIAVRMQQNGYVTVVGPGGAGKTSIAVAAAQHFRAAGQPVAFVDLSTLNSSQFVIPAMATALGISLGLDDPIAGVIALLRAERPILIIDNCEHVITTAAALLERISHAVPEAQIIATTREPLRTRHENVVHLAKLGFPDPGAITVTEEALQYPAVRLFLAKAGRGDDADLDPGYVQAVASICARLDGLALAIELAAGTAGSFGAEALTELFREGFAAMHRGRRDAPLRHQTLEAALDWSYRLLPEQEAVLFELLSVFAGRFSAEDAESIYAAGLLDPMTGRDALGQLVAKSLVSADVIAGALRYRLVESTWVYASQRLLGSPQVDLAKRLFAARVLARMQEAEREWSFLTAREWLGRYGEQMDDLRAAIRWAFDPQGNARMGVDLVVAALPLWQEQSAFQELLAALEQALAFGNGGDLPPLSRARMHMAQAWGMTLARQVHPQTGEAWRESIQFANAAGDGDLALQAVCGEAVYLAYSGRPLTALRSMLDFARSADVEWSKAPGGMRFLAHDEIYVGRLASADARLQFLRQSWGEARDEQGLSRFQVDLPVAINLSSSLLAWLQGRSELSVELSDRAIARAENLNHMISLGNAICLAGLPAAFLDGDLGRAEDLQGRLAEVARRESVGIYEGTALFFAGAIAAARGNSNGLDTMAASIEALWANGWRLRTSLYRCLLAEAWLCAGDPDCAIRALKPLLDCRDAREERWSHPELWRVGALIAAHTGQTDRAQRYFRRGLHRSQTMGATAFMHRIKASTAELGLGLD